MIFIVSWCYGGLAMVVFILFWQGSYPPWWHHTGIVVDPYMNLSFPLVLTGRGSPNGYYKIIRIAALQKKEESYQKDGKV